MKKFIASLVFVLIGGFVVDRVGGMAMWWVNQHTRDISGPKIKYLVNEVHEDVILMGTSRCNLHYVPSIISDTLGMSVYNGGIDASNNIYAHYIMLCHKPIRLVQRYGMFEFFKGNIQDIEEVKDEKLEDGVVYEHTQADPIKDEETKDEA